MCMGRCRAAQLANIRQMSRQVSRGSAGEYQADEQTAVTGLRLRLSIEVSQFGVLMFKPLIDFELIFVYGLLPIQAIRSVFL